MLYVLQHVESQTFIYLIQDKEYIVGRKNADIVIPDDASISRKHSVISTKSNSVTLTDCASKYGTFHNQRQIDPKIDVFLKEGDTVKFGMYASKYSFGKVPIVTTASGLLEDQKTSLKTKLASIGGHVINNWDKSCTHLTVNEIILTIKVLHALIDGKPIVKPEYWDTFLENIKSSKPLPKPEDFKPPVTEALINDVDLSANPERKVLFRGKLFVFITERIKKKMADLISKAGGCSISWERQNISLLDVKKSKNKYIFVHDDIDEIPDSLKHIHSHLKELGERTIPMQEIALAVVLCSCEKDCNPKFNRINKVFQMPENESQSEVFALAENTPSEDGTYDAVYVPKREDTILGSLEVDFENLYASPIQPRNNTSGPVTSTQIENNRKEDALDKNLPQKNIPSVAKKPDSSRTPLSVTNSSRIPSTSRVEDDPPSKRMRLDNTAKSDFIFPTPKSGPSFATPRSTSSSNSNSDISLPSNTTSQGSVNPRRSPLGTSRTLETKKRKADETLGSSSKRTPKINRFALFTKPKTEPEENLFIALRVKREPDPEDEDNPFLQILNAPRQTPVKRTPPKPIEASPRTYDSGFKYVPSKPLKSMWLSTKNIKPEIVKIDPEMDPELRETFEKFRNVVVIETLPLSALRKKPRFQHDSSLESNTGKKNFKNFKKVQPRHPQTTILLTSFSRVASSDSVFAGSDVERQAGDDVEEEEEREPIMRRPVKNKTPGQFVF